MTKDSKQPERQLQPERLDQETLIRNARMGIMRKAKEKRDEISKGIKDKNLGLGGRAKGIQVALGGMLKEPIKEAVKEWEARIEALRQEQDSNKNLKKFKEALDRETTFTVEKMEEAERLLVKYIEEMAKASGGKLDAEALAAMREGSKNAKDMAELVMNGNSGIKEAVRWVLRAPNLDKNKDESAADSGKEGAFKTLETELRKGGEMTSYAWRIVGFMTPEDKKEFTAKYVKTCTYDEAEKFMAEGNKLGTFTLEERENILKGNFKDSYKELTSEQKQQFAINWQVQNVFKEQAKKLVHVPLGSRNAMGEMFTFKNILLFVGQLVAVGGLVANAATTMFAGGAWKKPGKAMHDFLNNSYVQMAGATLFGINMYKKTGSVDSMINNLSGDQGKAKKEATRDLNNALNSNPAWKNILDDFGIQQLGEFVRSKIDGKTQEVDKKQLTLEEFTGWLNKKTQNSTGDQKNKYNSLAKRFSNEGGKYTISDKNTKFKTDDTQFKMLANAFYVYRLWGASTTDRFDLAKKGMDPSATKPNKVK